jgi:hypothetical protein
MRDVVDKTTLIVVFEEWMKRLQEHIEAKGEYAG